MAVHALCKRTKPARRRARLVQQLAEHGRERGLQLGREALHDRAAGRAPAGRRQEVHDAPAQLARGLQLRPWDRM